MKAEVDIEIYRIVKKQIELGNVNIKSHFEQVKNFSWGRITRMVKNLGMTIVFL